MNFVIVSGFQASGSSAVIDYLKEFDGFFECGKEIRFIRDPYGLVELEQSLIDHWEFINSTVAIEDFLKMSKIWARFGDLPWSKPGLSYAKYINKDYVKISQEFIDSLTDHTYKKEFFACKLQKPYFSYVIDRNRRYIQFKTRGKIKIANQHTANRYFATPTRDQFYQAVQLYIERLFAEHKKSDNDFSVILDQGVSPNNTQIIHKYFKKAKMIIVDRDPRDMYLDIFDDCSKMSNHPGSLEDGREFILRMKAVRRTMEINDPDILYIKFEDLVRHYDETTEKIKSFLNLSEKEHLWPKKYFKPEVSLKNTLRWKKYYYKYKDALDSIEKGLPDLIYHEK